MDTTFINSENSKISDPHRLFIILLNKINLQRSYRYVALSNLSIYYTWKSIKKSDKKINLKHQLRHSMKSFNFLMDHILYQIFKITLHIY